MPPERCILHVDMDAFYASVEQRDQPDLRGQPVIVGGLGSRGVVSAASYEARTFGVRSAMAMHDARQRCPAGHFLPVRMAHYRGISQQVFAEFARITPLVEGLSLDEAFLDVSGALHPWQDDPNALGRDLKNRIRTATGLIASVGIGPNKLLAKLASKLGKPDGLYAIAADEAAAVLAPLPIGDLPGIGRKTAPRLQRLGIRTIGNLAHADPARLRAVLGRYAEVFQQRALGIDNRPVQESVQEQSISRETTFATDNGDDTALERCLLGLCDEVAGSLRRRGLLAGSLQLKLRTPDFATHTRARRINPASQDGRTLFALARELLRTWRRARREPLRLLGVGASQLREGAQYELFGGDEKHSALLDEVRGRFGPDALKPGRLLDD